jgi:hypothetical protein
MNTKFKIGDKIAVYDFNRDLRRARVICTITEVLTDGSGALYTDQNYTKESPFDATMVVPEQCRKIKNSSIWVSKDLRLVLSYSPITSYDPINTIEWTEYKKVNKTK